MTLLSSWRQKSIRHSNQDFKSFLFWNLEYCLRKTVFSLGRGCFFNGFCLHIYKCLVVETTQQVFLKAYVLTPAHWLTSYVIYKTEKKSIWSISSLTSRNFPVAVWLLKRPRLSAFFDIVWSGRCRLKVSVFPSGVELDIHQKEWSSLSGACALPRLWKTKGCSGFGMDWQATYWR